MNTGRATVGLLCVLVALSACNSANVIDDENVDPFTGTWLVHYRGVSAFDCIGIAHPNVFDWCDVMEFDLQGPEGLFTFGHRCDAQRFLSVRTKNRKQETPDIDFVWGNLSAVGFSVSGVFFTEGRELVIRPYEATYSLGGRIGRCQLQGEGWRGTKIIPRMERKKPKP